MPPVRRRAPLRRETALGGLATVRLVIGAYGRGPGPSVDEARRLYLAHADEIRDHCERAGNAFEDSACYRDFEPEHPAPTGGPA